MTLNLIDAVQMYRMLKSYLFEPPEDMTAELYIMVLLTGIHANNNDRIVFEILALGTEFDAEYHAELPTETLIDRFTKKLADNNILSLKKLMEELPHESNT
jgi:hypothetical protein